MALAPDMVRMALAQARISGCTQYRSPSAQSLHFFDADKNLRLAVTQGNPIWTGCLPYNSKFDTYSDLQPIKRLIDRYVYKTGTVQRPD